MTQDAFQEALAYVKSRGYSNEAAERIVMENGVDTILICKQEDKADETVGHQPTGPVIARPGRDPGWRK